jgi:hypothetical protein
MNELLLDIKHLVMPVNQDRMALSKIDAGEPISSTMLSIA